MNEILPNSKSYLMGAGMVVVGVVGWLTGLVDAVTAGQYVMGGLSVIALRLGIAKSSS